VDEDHGRSRRSFLAGQVRVEQEALTACSPVLDVSLDTNGRSPISPHGSSTARSRRRRKEGNDKEQSSWVAPSKLHDR
jgi:hypothetical protein